MMNCVKLLRKLASVPRLMGSFITWFSRLVLYIHVRIHGHKTGIILAIESERCSIVVKSVSI